MVAPAWRWYSNGSPNYSLMVDDALHTFLATTTAFLLAVLFMLSRNRYQRTLRTHASRFFASQRELKSKQKTFVGSMAAEEVVMRILEEEGWRHVYLRRRVPISRLGHNREIDVIGVGSVILVVEVKHWRGYVWSNGRNWYQAANYESFVERQKHKEALRKKSGGRAGGGGTRDRVPAPAALEFEDVQADNVIKAAALRRYIENTRRIALPDLRLLRENATPSTEGDEAPDNGEVPSPPSPVATSSGTRYTDAALHMKCGVCVVPVVVFTHPSVRLDPVTLRREAYVFTLDTFRIFAREALRGNVSAEAPNAVVLQQNALRSLLAHGMRRVLRSVPILRGLVSRRNEGYFLDEDRQEEVAHAIDVLRTWDLVFLHDGSMITGDVVRVEAPTANCMYERKHLLDMKITWNSSAIFGTIMTLIKNEAGSVQLVLTTGKRLAFKRKEKNKPRDANGNIVFAIQPERHTNVNLDDRLYVKTAGSSEGFRCYRLIDIREVRLSHHLHETEKYL